MSHPARYCTPVSYTHLDVYKRQVLGLIALTIVTSIGGSADSNLLVVLIKIAAFFLFVIVVGVLVKKGMDWYIKNVHSTDLQLSLIHI